MELTDSEIRKLVSYDNQATYDGKVNADGCTSEFGFTIYMKDGSKLYAGDTYTRSPRIEVSSPHGDPYWIKGEALASYAQALIEKYGLTVS